MKNVVVCAVVLALCVLFVGTADAGWRHGCAACAAPAVCTPPAKVCTPAKVCEPATECKIGQCSLLGKIKAKREAKNVCTPPVCAPAPAPKVCTPAACEPVKVCKPVKCWKWRCCRCQ